MNRSLLHGFLIGGAVAAVGTLLAPTKAPPDAKNGDFGSRTTANMRRRAICVLDEANARPKRESARGPVEPSALAELLAMKRESRMIARSVRPVVIGSADVPTKSEVSLAPVASFISRISRTVDRGIASIVTNVPSPAEARSKLLPPPPFAEGLPAEFETDEHGEVLVRWGEVPRAVRYRILVQKENGEVVKTASTPGTLLYLKDIPVASSDAPTEYLVALVSINREGEQGPPGELRRLVVNKSKVLLAPGIKEIRIED